MNSLDVTRKVVKAFCVLAPVDQVAFVKQCWHNYEKDVFIFPMSEFNAFCKKHFGENYVTLTNPNLYDSHFSSKDSWCMYNPKWNCFESAEEPKYFTYFTLDEITNCILNMPELMESKMGFTKEEIRDMRNAVTSKKNG